MATSNEQARHTYLISLLGQWAYSAGYKLTSGDAYRDPRVHGEYGEKVGYGAANSNHKLKLAHDFNLFLGAELDTNGFLVGGTYTHNGEDYRPLAEYWESLHPENRSGIRYNDANHFETVPGYDNRSDPL